MLRKTRTFISSFVVKYSYPLNYKPVDKSFSLELKTNIHYLLSERKEYEYIPLRHTVLVDSGARTLFSTFTVWRFTG